MKRNRYERVRERKKDEEEEKRKHCHGKVNTDNRWIMKTKYGRSDARIRFFASIAKARLKCVQKTLSNNSYKKHRPIHYIFNDPIAHDIIVPNSSQFFCIVLCSFISPQFPTHCCCCCCCCVFFFFRLCERFYRLVCVLICAFYFMCMYIF